MKSQMASPSFSAVYSALVAVVNARLPAVGRLLLTRLVLQFKRAFKRNDKPVCAAALKFIAHLVNQVRWGVTQAQSQHDFAWAGSLCMTGVCSRQCLAWLKCPAHLTLLAVSGMHTSGAIQGSGVQDAARHYHTRITLMKLCILPPPSHNTQTHTAFVAHPSSLPPPHGTCRAWPVTC